MRDASTTRHAADGVSLYVHGWLPDVAPPRAVVHISHGMAEHGARYARLAATLTDAGFAVYANDHRGHGRTARDEEDRGIFTEEGGWAQVLADLVAHLQAERAAHPGLPLALLGHSMGSLLAQQLLYEHGALIDAAALSGTSGRPPAIATLGRAIARVERWRLGKQGRSPVLKAMTFDDFNKRFKGARTDFDWLSRDAAEVDKYIADPLCGFQCSVQLWIDVLDALPILSARENQARIRKDLPIYICSGERDPLGDDGRSVRQLADAYRAAGIERVTCNVYPDARHEVLNETNREEVTADLMGWLESVVSPAQ